MNVVGHVLKICCGCVGDSLWMVCCVEDELCMVYGGVLRVIWECVEDVLGMLLGVVLV